MSDPLERGTTKLGDGYVLSWRPMMFGGLKIKVELKGSRTKHRVMLGLKRSASINMACWVIKEGTSRDDAMRQIMKGINIAYRESGGSAEMEGAKDAAQEEA